MNIPLIGLLGEANEPSCLLMLVRIFRNERNWKNSHHSRVSWAPGAHQSQGRPQGSKSAYRGQDGTIREQETGLIGPEPVIVPGEAAVQLQEIMYTQIPNDHGNVYYIELLEEKNTQEPEQGELKLDGATENELIGSWNDRLSLKRERRAAMGLEAIEEELLRRKKQKREAWYDEYGRLLCVTISDESGTKTLVCSEQGRLEPNHN